MNRKRSLWPWIIATVIAVLVLYVGSFGPACWLDQRNGFARPVIAVLYRPAFVLIKQTPLKSNSPIRNAVVRYMQLGESCPMQPVLSREGALEDWQVLPQCRFGTWPGQSVPATVFP